MLLRLVHRVLLRLVHGLGHLLLAALDPLRRGRGFNPAKLELHQPGHRLELGLEVLEPRIVLPLKLVDQFVELSLVGIDLLFKQSRPVLQVPANITHCIPSFMAFAPTTERAGRFTQDQYEHCLAAAPGKSSKIPVTPPPGCLGGPILTLSQGPVSILPNPRETLSLGGSA